MTRSIILFLITGALLSAGGCLCAGRLGMGEVSGGAHYAETSIRKDRILRGAERLRLGMRTNEVIEVFGVPDVESVRRAPTPMFSFRRGQIVGNDYEYWVHWELSEAKRWLVLHFTLEGELKSWRGNLTGTYFKYGAVPFSE